jgi:ankyrin repeat protein
MKKFSINTQILFLIVLCALQSAFAMEPVIDPVANNQSIAAPISNLDKQLIRAAIDGNLERVQELAWAGANVNAQDPQNSNKSPLRQAAAYGHIKIVAFLLDSGADIEIKDVNQVTPFMCAAGQNHIEIVDLLIARGACLNSRCTRGLNALASAIAMGYKQITQLLLAKATASDLDTPFIMAAERNDLELVCELIKRGVDINAPYVQNNNETALHIAANLGHLAIAETLLNAGAFVDSRANLGITPLITAAVNGNLEIIRLLVQRGATIHARAEGAENSTTLMIAVELGHRDVVAFLVHSGASADSTSLFAAIQVGNLDLINLLLSAGADVNSVHAQLGTPLMHAIAMKQKEVISLLFSHGAKVNILAGEPLATALAHAAGLGDIFSMGLLLDAGAEIDLPNGNGITPLMVAADAGQCEAMQLLLKRGAQVNLQAAGGDNNSALHYAARSGHIQAIKILIGARNTIDLPNIHGLTPLMLSSARGHLGAVQELVRQGANINMHAAGSHSITSLFLAAELGRHNVVEFLLKSGAEVDLANDQGTTPLMIAAYSGHSETMQLLIDHGAQINAQAAVNHNMTALLQAVYHGRLAATALLLKKGAQIDLPSSVGATPLMLATTMGHLDVVRLLLEHKAAVNAQAAGVNNRTALHQAVDGNHAAIADLLIEHGADINATATNGSTPLMESTNLIDVELLELLLQRGAAIDMQAAGTRNMSALMFAAERGRALSMLALFEAGANIALQDENGDTAISICLQNDGEEFVSILLTCTPETQHEPIRNCFTGLLAIQRLRQTTDAHGCWHVVDGGENTSPLPRDLRTLASRAIISSYMIPQLQRVESVISLKNNNNQTARDIALGQREAAHAALENLINAEQDIDAELIIAREAQEKKAKNCDKVAQLLDLNNPDLRQAIWREVREILLQNSEAKVESESEGEPELRSDDGSRSGDSSDSE